MTTAYSNPIKEERHDEAEIRELAARMVEANRNKMSSTQAVRQQQQQQQAGTQANSAYRGNINYWQNKNLKRPGAATPQNASGAAAEPASDEESARGKFGWVQLGKTYIPYIFRRGEKYCAVRMVEMKLLNKYLNYLHQDIYSCTCIRSYYITEVESKLLNEINMRHCDFQFGRDAFTTRDLIVRLSDANEFYNFLDVCYSKLIQGTCNPKDRCGFIRINKESVVPYTVKNDQKYVPLFYFEGETDNLKLKADKLEGWDLSYLKFCCKVQGIRNELFAHDSCAVISLNAIKSYFPPGTGFEDYWPSKVVDSQLLLNGKNPTQIGQWTRQPPTPPAAAAVAAAAAAKCQPKNGQASTPQINRLDQNIFGPYALASSQAYQQLTTTQANAVGIPTVARTYPGVSPTSPRPASRHQYYNQSAAAAAVAAAAAAASSGITQPPPPLVRSNIVPPSTGSTVSTPYSTPPLTASPNVMMLPDLQTYSTSAAARNNVSMAQRFPPPLIPVRNSNGSPRYHNQYTTSANDAVDLSNSLNQRRKKDDEITSTPSNPVDLAHRGPSIRSEETNHLMTNGRSSMNSMNSMEMGGKKLTPIAETPTSGTHIPYKMQKVLVEGKMIPCINLKPFVWTELLVTLPDIIQHFFNPVPLGNCRRVMDVLGIELYRGNRQQMQILKDSGKCQTLNDVVPLVQVHDVLKYMPQIKYMLGSMSGGSEPLAKRQRTS